MKAGTQFSVSLLSLGILLGMMANSHATDIADLPLKASVLAKPNVIFGLDESGSMDSEVMLYNNDGAFWWNFSSGTGWGVDSSHPNASLRAIHTSWFNNAGNADATWRKMIYLFPNGTGTGDRQMGDAANDHFAIMPTTEFATLRWSGIYKDGSTYHSAPSDPALSPMHNPIYYNPLITYAPWAPAQLSTGAFTSSAASTTVAKSHPVRGTTVHNLTVDVPLAATPSDNWVFTALPGMKVPAGSKKRVCNSDNTNGCVAWADVGSQENAANNKVTRVAMAYYPATFWVREACTVPSTVNVATDSCTYVPGSTTVTLKRYEIKSTSTLPFGRDYAAEMQNFANWFQYHRKRRLMLAGAMGETMENLTGMRLGVVAFNAVDTNTAGNVTMLDADATSASSNRLRVAGQFYEVPNGSGTPTRKVLKYIGEQFKRTDSTTVNGRTSYNMVQYACQRNSAFIVTDGFANNDSVTPPAWDTGKSATPFGIGAPYEASFTHDGILADLALRYYVNNPRSDLAGGKLQATPRDSNTNLHMNTYGLTLGARGTLFLSETSPPPTTTTAWPDPNTNRNPTSVDDLWRATLSGRGKMYLATTPTETASAIQAGLTDILSQTGAQGGIAVSTVNLPRGDSKAYFGTYNPAGWAGDLTANTIDAVTGAVASTATWKAGDLLVARDWTTRIIATSSGGGANAAAVPFNVTNAASTVNPGAAYGSDAAVIDYLRGDRSGEGDLFRARTSLMGAIINSEPVVSREDAVVYVASGEGMLHAFDTSAANPGKELWAFVPKQVLPIIGETVERSYTFGTKLDGTPVLGKYSSTGKILVAGMGVAGRGYFALDVSNPRVSTANQLVVKWEFPGATDAAKVGQTLGRPVIVKSENNGYVVLLASGYNNAADGPGRLWMLNADTGAVLKVFTTTASSTDSGLAHVAAFGEPPTGTVRYAYGGDLLGNVWRFDLSDPSATPTPKLLTTLTGPTGVAQPITTAPELLWHKDEGKRVVMIGTGRLLDIGDFLSTDVQSIYAIADDATLLPLSNPRTTLAKQIYVRGATPNLDTLTGPSVNWTTNRGWFIDLPAKEQINTRPTIAYGRLAFVSNSNGGSSCEASSYLYVVDVLSGNKVAGTDFISTLLSDKSNSSGVTALLTRGQKIVGTGQDGDGKPWSRDITAGSPINPSKNSWFEVRR